MTLRAVVVGTGWAGEGHTTALRAAGVDVVALCGRTPDPARAMAARLGVADVRFDWRSIGRLRPDIVSIATPGAAHCDIATFSASMGCHVVCDKPLALSSTEADGMLEAVQAAGSSTRTV